MFEKQHGSLGLARSTGDAFSLLRQMTSELDRAFEGWPSIRWQPSGSGAASEGTVWSPKIDVFERDDRLVTRVDLPGMKQDDVTVEVTDGYLTLSGERQRESEEKKDNVYRAEREYGSFYRAVPLPDGVKLEDIKATFSDGVLEVSVPMPAHAGATVHKVPIEARKPAVKGAA